MRYKIIFWIFNNLLFENVKKTWDVYETLRSQVKIYENFANYFLKTKANNKCIIVLK